ncbi:MAG TPA: hypothetical protein DHW66_09610 [Alteromonas sp.]|nr:hypothetical protein [Alteromonas sp.]
MKSWISVILLGLMLAISHVQASAAGYPGIIRIAELDIDPQHLDEYLALLTEEAEASVRLEPGVIAIFPMVQEQNPTAVRILEIYASQQAYESHLKTAHFLKYKKATLHMVKALRLIDMQAIDARTMSILFSKMATPPPMLMCPAHGDQENAQPSGHPAFPAPTASQWVLRCPAYIARNDCIPSIPCRVSSVCRPEMCRAAR